MEKLAKLEAFINKYLSIVFALISDLGHSLVPDKFKARQAKPKKEVDKNKKEFKEFWKQKFLSLKKTFANIGHKITGSILVFFLKFKNIKAETFHPKNFASGIYNLFLKIYLPLKRWVSSFKPETVTAFVIVMSLSYLVGIEIYNSTKKLVEEANGGRAPASVPEPVVERRPAYYKLSQREWEIYMVNLPVYIGGPADLRSLIIDFSLLASNQYIKMYLLKNEHLVKDRLNLGVEPTLPSFPLEEEGKTIVKEKIRFEVNQLLKDLQIEGEIEEVNLINVLSN